MHMTIDYEVGDTIEYSPFGGGVRRVLVEAKESDIKNGYPGFDGTIAGGEATVWGYDDQIIRVVKKA
jgi:hypothetical protein